MTLAEHIAEDIQADWPDFLKEAPPEHVAQAMSGLTRTSVQLAERLAARGYVLSPRAGCCEPGDNCDCGRALTRLLPLDEAWKAAEAALPKRHSLHLDTNGRGTYVARSLPPFMPYEEWFEARREEFGDSPAEAVAALAAALSKPASPAIAARDGGET